MKQICIKTLSSFSLSSLRKMIVSTGLNLAWFFSRLKSHFLVAWNLIRNVTLNRVLCYSTLFERCKRNAFEKKKLRSSWVRVIPNSMSCTFFWMHLNILLFKNIISRAFVHYRIDTSWSFFYQYVFSNIFHNSFCENYTYYKNIYIFYLDFRGV